MERRVEEGFRELRGLVMGLALSNGGAANEGGDALTDLGRRALTVEGDAHVARTPRRAVRNLTRLSGADASDDAVGMAP